MTIITLNPTIKADVASKIVEQAHPGWPDNGAWYTDGERLWWRDTIAQWNPWADEDVVVSVEEFIDATEIDADPTIDLDTWRSFSFWADWVAAYAAAEDLDAADVEDQDVLDFARESYPDLVEATERDAENQALLFVLAEMTDTAEVEDSAEVEDDEWGQTDGKG